MFVGCEYSYREIYIGIPEEVGIERRLEPIVLRRDIIAPIPLFGVRSGLVLDYPDALFSIRNVSRDCIDMTAEHIIVEVRLPIEMVSLLVVRE